MVSYNNYTNGDNSTRGWSYNLNVVSWVISLVGCLAYIAGLCR